MNWILLSPPPLSSEPDNAPKFGTCTRLALCQNLLHDTKITGLFTSENNPNKRKKTRTVRKSSVSIARHFDH